MEITILRKNIDVEKTIVVKDEFDFPVEKLKFIQTDIRELIINDILVYCYPIVSYIKYDSIKDIAVQNIINIVKKENVHVENLYTTVSDLDGYMIISKDKTSHDNPNIQININELKKIKIPKNTSIQIVSFLLFDEFSKHQTFKEDRFFKINDLFFKSEYEKLRNYIGDNSYLISNDLSVLKEQIQNNFKIHKERMIYIRNVFNLIGLSEEQKQIITDKKIDIPKIFTDKDFSYMDSFYFNLFNNNKIEAYYSFLLNLPNKTNSYLEEAKMFEKHLKKIKMNDVKMEDKQLENILLDNFSKKRFNGRKFIALSDKEKLIIKNDYENYKKKYTDFISNKCEHKSLVSKLQKSTMEEELKLFSKILNLVDRGENSKNEFGKMKKCNKCGYDLICPHKIELYKLRKNNSTDRQIRDKMMTFCSETSLNKSYYCNTCNEKILTEENEEDVIFVKSKQIQSVNIEVNEISQMIYTDAGLIIKNYVTFSNVINVKNFIRNIVDIISDKLNVISAKLHKNKTASNQMNYNIIKIHSYCYIIATIMFIITNNPANIEINLVLKKEKVNENETDFMAKKLDDPILYTNSNNVTSELEVVSSVEDAKDAENRDAEPLLEVVSSTNVEDDVYSTNVEDDVYSTNVENDVSSAEDKDDAKVGGAVQTQGKNNNLKYLFDTGYNIAIKLSNSYMGDANLNYADIKNILSEGFIYIRTVTGSINVGKNVKLDQNIINNSNFKLLQNIHSYYDSGMTHYKDILNFNALLTELPDNKKINKRSIEKIDEIIDSLYKNGVNIFKYVVIPPKLTKALKEPGDNMKYIFAKSCMSIISLLQNTNTDMMKEINIENNLFKKELKHRFGFFSNQISEDNKFVIKKEFYKRREFRYIILEDGEKIDISTLNKYL